MCGRYTYLYKWKQLHRLMRLLEIPQEELFPRYNVKPTQRAPIVRLNERGQRVGVMLEWGLVPAWAGGIAEGGQHFNARGESMFSKPTFRAAAKERRCLVPVSGFYEWQKVEGEKYKQPYWIGREDREPFCFGGPWESWRDPAAATDTPALDTFAIVTTSPNALMAPLHDRMPVIVAEADWEAWLDPASQQTAIERMLIPFGGSGFHAYPVERTGLNTARDDAGLAAEVTPPPRSPGLFG